MPERLRTLLSADAVARRVESLAAEISRDYRGADELLLVGILRGCFIFLADLSRRLSIPRRIDFIAVESYRGSRSDSVRLVMDLRTEIRGRHTLLVDDIVDSGETLSELSARLRARRPASLKTCALVRKQRPEPRGPAPDYLGFEIPDRWVVGYGLDYDGRYRALPEIAVLEDPQM